MNDGKIKDVTAALRDAVSVGAPTYLYDYKMLVQLELQGLVYVATKFSDFEVYRATDAGRLAFARGTAKVV